VANLKKMGIQGKYILFVGSIEPRKNIQNLVEAYTKLPMFIKDTYSLVLAGGKGWKDEQILASIKDAQNNGNKIIQTGYITEAEKDALYKDASLFVLPSHYEGFGMPIYEAMQYKIPIVASNIPVFNEIAGDSITYFDKDSVGDIANVMEKIISSKSLQKNRLELMKNDFPSFRGIKIQKL
jgi:glycosyltransferase involved in cell wall biosynthesis